MVNCPFKLWTRTWTRSGGLGLRNKRLTRRNKPLVLWVKQQLVDLWKLLRGKQTCAVTVSRQSRQNHNLLSSNHTPEHHHNHHRHRQTVKSDVKQPFRTNNYLHNQWICQLSNNLSDNFAYKMSDSSDKHPSPFVTTLWDVWTCLFLLKTQTQTNCSLTAYDQSGATSIFIYSRWCRRVKTERLGNYDIITSLCTRKTASEAGLRSSIPGLKLRWSG